MTRQQAEEFLVRNPRVDLDELLRIVAHGKLERFWNFTTIDHEPDALTDQLEVARALGRTIPGKCNNDRKT